MADNLKVIEGLRHCAVLDDCSGCPYKGECWSKGRGDFGRMVRPMMLDALELLEGKNDDG